MGSAAARALCARGASVVAFDRFSPPHGFGSTHGHTRIIREAYYEHPLYVPLVQRAYELWAQLERESGKTLLQTTGGVMVGVEQGALLAGALESARTHGIAHDLLDAAALRSRFPAYAPQAEWVGLYEHRAGMLFPERCVTAALDQARANGADIRAVEPVTAWRRSGAGIRVETSARIYEVGRLVVAAGSWLPEMEELTGVRLPLEIERQLSHWFEPTSPNDGRYDASGCPVGLWETTDGGEIFATLPDDGNGVKCGMHHAGSPTSPQAVDRAISVAENEEARRVLENVMPGAGGRLRDARVCLYTNTPDRHFLIDWVSDARVLILSPCSGHGFKFASAIGEIAAQLCLDGRSWIDLTPFSLSRFN